MKWEKERKNEREEKEKKERGTKGRERSRDGKNRPGKFRKVISYYSCWEIAYLTYLSVLPVISCNPLKNKIPTSKLSCALNCAGELDTIIKLHFLHHCKYHFPIIFDTCWKRISSLDKLTYILSLYFHFRYIPCA